MTTSTFSQPTSTTTDPLGAFMSHAPYSMDGYAEPTSSGALSGYTLAIKDLFDVAGLKTGAGSPTWLEGNEPAAKHAPVVASLLDAGPRFVGKTLTDEMAFSLNGENAHYGTPTNPSALGRIPGGSSAGSATAVAGDLVDIGLGSDTGGSVRLPASYCGVWGLRPTHGRIALEGTVPLAPSFDTAGWFTRSPDLLQKVGDVLLDGADSPPITNLVLATDMFARVDDNHRQALQDKAAKAAEMVGLPLEEAELASSCSINSLEDWRMVFRVCQSSEVWEVHGEWVERAKPAFGPGVKDRFAYAKSLQSDEISEAREKREIIAAYLGEVIKPGTALLVPGAVSVAPLKGLDGPELDHIRNRALDILCPSGLGRLPQLALPALSTDDGPIGLGIIGASNSDEQLLALGTQLTSL